MKKAISALLLACMLFACKKETNIDQSTPASDSKVPVKFSVENFLISQHDISENGRVETDTSLSRFYKVFYMAFTSDGNTASYIEQDSTDNNFGVISDSLAPGTYTVVLGAWNRMNIYNSYITTNHSTLANAEFTAPLARPTGDFFYKKLQVTVSANGNPAIIDLTLDRIVGYLKLDFKDALPASDPNGAVTVYINNIPQSYMINTDIATNNYELFQMDRNSQTTWEYYIFGSTAPISLQINWKDKNTGAPQSKTISNVIMTANKKTIVTGYLYGVPENVGGGDLFLRTNQDWSTDSTIISIN